MAILTNKPSWVTTGSNTTVNLGISDLVSLISSSGADTTGYYTAVDSITGIPINWKRVVYYYQDSTGKQDTVVMFDTTQQVGKLKFSPVAKKNTWQLTRIIVEDFDCGQLVLTRSVLSNQSQDIDVVSPNLPPSSITLSSTSINENSGTFVGNITATDPNIGDTITLSLGGADAGSFQIVGSNALHLKQAADYETKSSYSLDITATDQENESKTVSFTISVNNVNEAPINFTLAGSGTGASVNENNTANQVIGSFITSDPDAGQFYTYTLVAGTGSTDNSTFNISGADLRVTNANALNFESKSSYSIRVRVTDSGIPAQLLEKVFTITVNNIAEAPTSVSLSSSSVAEGAAIGTLVGTLSAVDPDVGSSITFSIVGTGANDAGKFTIANGNQLKTAQVLDYEMASTASITVRATDNTGLYKDQTFTISVTNAAPTSLALDNATIAENLPTGTLVGTLSAVDPGGGSCTFSLVSGTGSSDNSSFQIFGSQLKTNAVLNYEVWPTRSIRIRATDGGSAYTEQAFTINITNVNETPTNILLSSSDITEQNAVGATVGTLSTVDPDGGTFTYTIISGDTSDFSISGSELLASSVFSYDTKKLYSVTIRSTDSGGLYYDKTFPINILKYYPAAGTWYVSGSALNNTKWALAGAGVQDAAVALGGRTDTSSSTTGSIENFNGYAWSALTTGASAGSGISDGSGSVGTGTQNAAIYTISQNFLLNYAYTWNGLSMNLTASSTESRTNSVMAGKMNDALWFGGNVSAWAYNLNPVKYNGSTWSTVSNSGLSQGRQQGSGGGTSTNNVIFVNGYYNSGYDSYYTDKIDIFNGSTWSSGPVTSSRRYNHAYVGSGSSGHSFGGFSGASAVKNAAVTANSGTETYNGSVWAAGGSLPDSLHSQGKAGDYNSALAFGGRNGSNISAMTFKYLSSTTTLLTKNMWYKLSTWDMLNDANDRGFTGTETAALAFAGYTSGSDSGNTYKFSGNAWTAASNSNFPSNRGRLAGVGTQSNTLSTGGKSYSTGTTGYFGYDYSELFNGTVWTSKATMPAARYDHAMVGTASDALVIGGAYGNSGGNPALSYLSSTATYNGTAWAAGVALSQAISGLAAVGTSNSALRIGGANYSSGTVKGLVEAFNGTTWTTKQQMAKDGRYSLGAAGTATDAIGFGGNGGSPHSTERYNGVNDTWTTVCSLSYNYGYNVEGTGTTSAALALNGTRGVEKFFG
jgi:hypothetical protein